MKNDTRIKKLMLDIKKKRKDLGKRPKSLLITTGLFRYGASGNISNINVIHNIGTFVEALAVMRHDMTIMKEAAEELGVDIPEYTLEGYTFDEWKEDFLTRISILKYEEKRKNLNILESKLKSLISEEAKTEMDLDDIEESLKS